MSGFETPVLPLTVDGVACEVAALKRDGAGNAVVCLHGFGSTKEDYGDIVLHPGVAERPFLAWDAPGCGATTCAETGRVSIPFLVETALRTLDHFGIDAAHLVGHSMGGLTALMFAHAHPDRVLSLTSVEGNVAPEDCFLSRQIHDYPAENDDAFFDAFIERNRQAPAYASAMYSASLRHKVRASAVRGIFESMVDLSDNADLMGKFLGLRCPTHFMYGDQNRHLGYLDGLRRAGVTVTEIPACGHFPMYSNPAAMWDALKAFFESAERRA